MSKNKPKPLKASCGFIKDNPFNRAVFDKRFIVLQINIRMHDEEGDYIYERVPQSIADLELKLGVKVMSYILRRKTSNDPSHQKAVLCLIDSSFDNSITNLEVNEYAWIYNKNVHENDFERLKLITKSLNCIEASKYNCPYIEGTSFEVPSSVKKNNLIFIQYFSIELDRCEGKNYLYPRLSRYTQLTPSFIDEIDKSKKTIDRYRMELTPLGHVPVVDPYGDYASCTFDTGHKNLVAATTDKRFPTQRAILFEERIDDLNKNFGDIYYFELEDMSFTEEREHSKDVRKKSAQKGSAQGEQKKIESILKSRCANQKLFIYIDPAISNQQDIDNTESLEKAIEGVKETFQPYFEEIIETSNLNVIDGYTTIGLTMAKEWYFRKSSKGIPDPKKTIYQKSPCAQIIEIEQKFNKNVVKKVLFEVFWKHLNHFEPKQHLSLLGLDFFPTTLNDYLFLFVETDAKKNKFYNFMLVDSSGVNFYLKKKCFLDLPDLQKFMNLEAKVRITSEDNKNASRYVFEFDPEAPNQPRWVSIQSSKVIVTPKGLAKSKRNQLKNQKQISFSLGDIIDAHEKCKNTSTNTYKRQLAIVENIVNRFKFDGLLEVSYMDLVDKDGNQIDRRCQLYKELYRENKDEIEISKHHLEKAFLRSYYDADRGVYSCGYYDGVKMTNEMRFPNLKVMKSNCKNLEKQVFDMTACYNLRADYSATVYPAPFKMLMEAIQRHEIVNSEDKKESGEKNGKKSR